MRALRICLLLVSATCTAAVAAERIDVEATQDEILFVGENLGGFVESHPDLRNYRLGLQSYRNGELEKAFRYFRIASRFSDKPSQSLIAEMYWYGKGVEQNRPLGYAWMDLAAERGYVRLLALREKYWEAMGPADRAQALELGEQVYADYGDAVAKRRLEIALRREQSRVVGSRTGFAGNAQVIAPAPGSIDPGEVYAEPPTMSVPATKFYDPAYWNPEQYYAWRERLWQLELREGETGVVKVGDLEQRKPGHTDE